MSQELLNTSAQRGLKPGSTGFCTVAMTAGMSPALEERLSLLSGYRWLVPPGEKGAEKNPIAYAHWRMALAGRTLDVLSRVCDAGFDYSRRSNRFAHHVVLNTSEEVPVGPAWLMLHGGILRTSWDGQPAMLPAGPQIPSGINPPRVCAHWAAATGDAGWAGVLADAFAADPSRVSYLIYAAGAEMLPLIDEALALLPSAMRWQVTFCTYFTDLPAGMACAWRCCVAGTKAAAEAQRHATSGVIIDLTRPVGAAPESAYATAARTGTPPVARDEAATEFDAWGTPEEDEPEPAPTPADEKDVLEGDQSWMPPMSATIVGVNRSIPPRGRSLHSARQGEVAPRSLFTGRRSRRVALLGAGLLWPLAVGGAGFWYWKTHAPTALPVPAKAANVDGQAHDRAAKSLEDNHSSTELQRATNEKLKRVTAERDALKSERETDASALKAASMSLDEVKKSLAKENERYAKDVNRLKKQLTAAQIPGTQPAAAPSDQVRAIESPLSVLTPAYEVWSGDGAGAPDLVELDGYSKPDDVTVTHDVTQKHYLLNLLFKCAVAAKAEGAKAASANAAVSSPGLAIAIPKQATAKVRASISCDVDGVFFRWESLKAQAAVQDDRNVKLRDWLRFCTLVVKRKGVVLACRPLYSGRGGQILKVNDQGIVNNLLPGIAWKDALASLELLPLKELPSGWESNGSNGKLMVTNTLFPQARFELELKKDSVGNVNLAVASGLVGDRSNTLYKLRKRSEAAAQMKKTDDNNVEKLRKRSPTGEQQRSQFQAEIQAAEAQQQTDSKIAVDAQREFDALRNAINKMNEMPDIFIKLCNGKTKTKMAICIVKLTRAR
ncbi:MAG TPA: hypothetical protein VFC78_06535 [Tepidisphaeraceae bacterium]|nr:hypothetical protein [Tepidisphaeraceae bacterium]